MQKNVKVFSTTIQFIELHYHCRSLIKMLIEVYECLSPYVVL